MRTFMPNMVSNLYNIISLLSFRLIKPLYNKDKDHFGKRQYFEITVSLLGIIFISYRLDHFIYDISAFFSIAFVLIYAVCFRLLGIYRLLFEGEIVPGYNIVKEKDN